MGPQIRIDILGGANGSYETSIASSNFNPNPDEIEIVAAWIHFRASPVLNPLPEQVILRIWAGISTNGGMNWAEYPIRPPAEFQSDIEFDPMTAYDDRTGTLWVGGISWIDPTDPVNRVLTLFVSRKLPGANTFQDSVVVDTGNAVIDKGWMGAWPD